MAVFVHAQDGDAHGAVEITGRVIRTSGRALLVAMDHGGEVWLPLRFVVVVDVGLDYGRKAFRIPRWLAGQRGITAWTPPSKASRRRSPNASRRRTGRT